MVLYNLAKLSLITFDYNYFVNEANEIISSQIRGNMQKDDKKQLIELASNIRQDLILLKELSNRLQINYGVVLAIIDDEFDNEIDN